MTIRAWRIVKQKYADSAFSGEGAWRFGGRWNSRGTSVVYMSSTRALGALEILVHLNPPVFFRYVALAVDFPASLVERLGDADLPSDWQEEPPSPSTQRIGNNWVREGRSAVLEVPSVIVPDEPNYLLNTAHRDFGRIVVAPPKPFAIDPRLLRVPG